MGRWQHKNATQGMGGRRCQGVALKNGMDRGAALLVSAVGKDRLRLVPGCLAEAYRGAQLEHTLGFKAR